MSRCAIAGCWSTIAHPVAGRGAAGGERRCASPNAPLSLERAPPLLGEHTEEILRELGWPDAKAHAASWSETAHDRFRGRLPRSSTGACHDQPFRGDASCRAFRFSTPDDDDAGAAPRPRCRRRRPARQVARAAARRCCIGRSSRTNGSSSASCCAIAPRCRRSSSELAILVTGGTATLPARMAHPRGRWRARPACRSAVIDDVHAGRRPVALDADGARRLRLCRGAASRRKTVGEETYRRALGRWQAWSAWSSSPR